MSELLSRAAEIRQSYKDRENRDRVERARLSAEDEARRELSRTRAAEFIGVMLSKNVPTIPIYQELIEPGQHGPLHIIQKPDRTLAYNHKGDGWVVRPWSYDRETSIVAGLFLTETGELYDCSEVKDTPPSGPSRLTQHIKPGEEYVMTDIAAQRTADAIAEPSDFVGNRGTTLFAQEDGLSLLAEALVHHEVQV
jgi:hypothetical protein